MFRFVYVVPVDGQWSAWGEYSQCTADCNGGEKTKVRRCDSPSPMYGGQQCVGEDTQTISCNEHPCAGTLFSYDKKSVCFSFPAVITFRYY